MRRVVPGLVVVLALMIVPPVVAESERQAGVVEIVVELAWNWLDAFTEEGENRDPAELEFPPGEGPSRMGPAIEPHG